MAQMLSQLFGQHMLAFWYHYAILFEALFILTTLDAGTRVGRFMIQDLLGHAVPALGRTRSLGANVFATALCVGAWGWFLYQGVVDPFGGINRLWPLFGIANQMLAGIALTLASVALVKMKRTAFLPVTLVPTLWLLTCTSTAAWIKIFDADPRLGFLAHARKLGEAVAQGQVLAPAKSIAEMQSVIMNDYVNAAMAGMFLLVMVTVFLAGVRAALAAHRAPYPTACETPAVAVGA
jgi:carbon starvation protein